MRCSMETDRKKHFAIILKKGKYISALSIFLLVFDEWLKEFSNLLGCIFLISFDLFDLSFSIIGYINLKLNLFFKRIKD